MKKQMMQKVTAVLLASVMCVSGVCANGGIVRAAGGDGQDGSTERIQELLDGMTTRQKITQMMMPDFRYWDEDLTDEAGRVGVTEMNSQIEQVVKDYDFGGVILFAQNVTGTLQTLNLTKAYQAAATEDGGIPLLIGIDQEGGSVYRLGTGTALPGNMAVGASGSLDYAKINGEIIGRELSSLGINCNFAPDMDVNNNPNNPVIGLRSFSDDPQLVADMGVAMIEGLNEYNIAASAKHFLGHGDTDTDSHTGLPVVNKSREELEAMELIPFKAAMAVGVDMFMTAHIAYPQIDDTKVISKVTGEEVNLPATLSKKVLTDLVRNDLGFDGVLITDAMNMAGVSGNFGQVEASIRAIQAGIDILLMPCVLYDLEDLADLDAIIEGIEGAVEDGTIPEQRLDESCGRILALKEKRGILDYDGSGLTEENALQQVGSVENRALERELSAAAVTVVKNEGDTLPIRLTKDSKVLFLTPWSNELALMAMGWNRAKEAGLVPAGAACKNICFEYQGTITPAIQKALEWADTVMVNSELDTSYLNPASWAHWSYTLPEAVTTYCKEHNKKSVVMSVDKPYDVQFYENADAVMAVYGCMGSSADPTEILNGGSTTTEEAFGPNMSAGVEVAFGVSGASGTLPVKIYKLDMATRTYTDEIVYERKHGLTYPAVEASTAEKAEKLIEAIGEVSYTQECADAIRAAEEYYETLSEEEQGRIAASYQKLLVASATYEALRAEAAAQTAEDARTGAEAAQEEAVTAKEGAETAKEGAEAAKLEAQTAQAEAEAAAQAAEVARAAAEVKAEEARRAQTAAENAKTAAEAAQKRAETATDQTGMYAVAAEAARNRAEGAKEAAQAAQAAAEAAGTKAQASQAAAEAAQAKAEASAREAVAANTKAQAAQAKAEAAVAAAEAAKEYAEAAKTAVESAKTAAEAKAAQAAASAENAAEAYKKADAARKAAQAAQTAAERARTAAEAEKTSALTAKTLAESAEKRAEAEADAAKEAKQGAQEAQVKAETAVAKAEALQGKAEAAQAKAEAAVTKAEAAQMLAEEAARKAKEEADKAKAEAEKAKEEAEKAKAEADRAKAEAEKAKGEIETVKLEVEKAKAEAQKAAAEAAAAQKKIEELQKPAVVQITLGKKAYKIKKGKKVRIQAKASDGSKLTFQSSNKKVARVTAKGVVRGIKKGKAVITVKAGSAAKKIKITVK